MKSLIKKSLFGLVVCLSLVGSAAHARPDCDRNPDAPICGGEGNPRPRPKPSLCPTTQPAPYECATILVNALHSGCISQSEYYSWFDQKIAPVCFGATRLAVCSCPAAVPPPAPMPPNP